MNCFFQYVGVLANAWLEALWMLCIWLLVVNVTIVVWYTFMNKCLKPNSDKLACHNFLTLLVKIDGGSTN